MPLGTIICGRLNLYGQHYYRGAAQQHATTSTIPLFIIAAKTEQERPFLFIRLRNGHENVPGCVLEVSQVSLNRISLVTCNYLDFYQVGSRDDTVYEPNISIGSVLLSSGNYST